MKRLLIANRGEIARRIMRTAHAMGIETVAVFSDADSSALHVREATASYALKGNTSADTYLRFDKLLAAAKATGADAVHPGYGFLSENAEFAQAVLNAGLIWVGPPPSATLALGNKAAAKRLALANGVPVLPGYNGLDQSDECFVAEAEKVGFPLMVKATAGGGGRGMRLVHAAAELVTALASARAEALSSFGNGELLMERALLAPRHIEFQVFADAHGHCIHLGERDCSMQRRNQKIIEEGPSPAVNEPLRQRMGACAVALAQGAGYVGAGTVEFLLQDGEFFLMEMNTRLQVEHPVTEFLTGIDLVEWQLRVARGETLPLEQAQVPCTGHAIEVRLCAEDENFIPHTGEVLHFLPTSLARFDHAIAQGSVVSPHYDSMLGKLIAHAPTRTQAIDALALALQRTQVLGLPTNRSFLHACLSDATFQAGHALVPYLGHAAADLRAELAARERSVLPHALAALHAVQALGGSFDSATRLGCGFARPLRVVHRGSSIDYQIMELGQGRLALFANLGEDGMECEVQVALHRDQVQGGHAVQASATIDGVQQRFTFVQVLPGEWHVQGAIVDFWLQDTRFEGSGGASKAAAAAHVLAPFNGKVVGLVVNVGDAVKRGDTVAMIESMKLQHNMAAGRDGIVKAVLVEVGQQVAPGQKLVQLEEEGV